MLYKIIGTDGKEYGPVTTDVLHQWIAQGRVNAQTRALSENATDWQLLGSLPEFAIYFAPSTPQQIQPLKQVGGTNGCAIAGLICGILSLVFCWCCGGFPFNVAGLICSLIGFSQINRTQQEGRALAVTGIILSAISFLIFLILLASGNAHVRFNGQSF